ncbi:MAG: alpha/beta fold hydrolase [Actinomycetota bacterium]
MTEGKVDFEGGELAYEFAGEGPTVTFLHPGLWDMRTWDREFARFADAGYRVVRFDQRGYGRSSRLTGAPYSNVRDLLAVLDATGTETTALVGCSMGGALAIDVTLTAPERVWALVPVAAGLAGVEDLEEEIEWWESVFAPIEAAMEAGDLERAQDLRLGIWAPLGTDDPAGARIRQIAFDNIHELTMDESGAEELDPPAALRLGEIDVPTLVVAADHDPPGMRRITDMIARGVLDARLVTIEGADHVVNLRQPEAFEAAVLPFLAEVR